MPQSNESTIFKAVRVLSNVIVFLILLFGADQMSQMLESGEEYSGAWARSF
jgi:hypothetical protein